MNVKIACTLTSRLVGLMGKDTFDGALLLVPCNDIHTFGMKRAIDVAFITRDGEVVDSFRNVRPNHRVRHRKAAATLERFSSDEAWYEPGDHVHHTLTFNPLA